MNESKKLPLPKRFCTGFPEVAVSVSRILINGIQNEVKKKQFYRWPIYILLLFGYGTTGFDKISFIYLGEIII